MLLVLPVFLIHPLHLKNTPVSLQIRQTHTQGASQTHTKPSNQALSLFEHQHIVRPSDRRDSITRGRMKPSIALVVSIRTMTKQNHARPSKHSPLSISLPRLAAGVLPMTLGLSGAGEPQVRKDAAVSGRASHGPYGRLSCANRRRI